MNPDDLIAGLLKGASAVVIDLVFRAINGDDDAQERLAAILPAETMLELNAARSREAERRAREAAAEG